jgi:hypothetical protein
MQMLKSVPLSGLLWFVFSLALHAQPLSGTYTVGGAGASYPTVVAAATALSANGVSGPVVFNISPGTYTGNVLIGPIQGASATNNIVFQSTNQDSTDVVITYPSGTSTTDNYAIRLNGASFVTFKYLTFQRTGSNDYTQIIDIINASHYISFYHNRLIGLPASNAATFKSLVYGANSSSTSNIVFEGNRFENGSYGMWLLGISQLPCCVDQGNKVLNNHFTGQYHCAVMLSYQGGPKIIGNTIEGTSTASGYGIYTFFCDNDLQILRNRVSVVNGRGIYVHNTAITGYPENLIANNFVSVGGNLASGGITLENSRYCNLYFNSVHIHNLSQASTAFRVEGIGSGFNNLTNNILMNSGGGYAAWIATSTSTPILSSNYNNLFTTDTLVGFWQSAGSQPSLAAYKNVSGLEQNSVSINPGFLSPTDLHATSFLMNNLGSPVASTATPVTEDIDLQLRHPLTPDIGADEYSFISLALIDIDTISSLCEGSIPGIRVKIRNLTGQPFSDSLHISYRFDNLPWQSAYQHLMIPAGDTVTAVLSSMLPIPAAGPLLLSCAISHPEDLISSDDTLKESVQIAPAINVNLGNDFLLCYNEFDTLTPNIFVPVDYLWFDNSVNPFWIADAAMLGVGVHQLWVKVTNHHECSWTDTVQIEVAGLPEPVIAVQPSYKTVMGGDSVTVICELFQSFFTCGSFSGYLWNNLSTDSMMIIMPFALPLGFWDARVMVTDKNGCSGFDTLRVLVDVCEGVEESDPHSRIRVSPNPSSSGIFYVDIFSPAQLRIFNITGQVIDNKMIKYESLSGFIIDLSGFPDGVYMLKATLDKGSDVIKLVKGGF